MSIIRFGANCGGILKLNTSGRAVCILFVRQLSTFYQCMLSVAFNQQVIAHPTSSIKKIRTGFEKIERKKYENNMKLITCTKI